MFLLEHAIHIPLGRISSKLNFLSQIIALIWFLVSAIRDQYLYNKASCNIALFVLFMCFKFHSWQVHWLYYIMCIFCIKHLLMTVFQSGSNNGWKVTEAFANYNILIFNKSWKYINLSLQSLKIRWFTFKLSSHYNRTCLINSDGLTCRKWSG